VLRFTADDAVRDIAVSSFTRTDEERGGYAAAPSFVAPRVSQPPAS
jgi:hypothetical protein